jgi:Domain of unknown function (DUF4328)
VVQPSSWQVQAGMSGHGGQGPVRPAWVLGALAMAMLGVWTVVTLVSVIALGLRVRLLGNAAAAGGALQLDDLSDLEASDSLILLLSLAQTAAILCIAVLWCLWLLRARDNAEHIMHLPQRFGKPWVVFGWVVPIVNLWIPKQVVDDVWEASSGQAGGHGRRLVRAWWACWLVFLIGERIASRAGDDLDLAAERGRTIAMIVLAVPGMAAAALAAVIIWKINSTQQAQSSRIAAAIAGGIGSSPQADQGRQRSHGD